MTTTLFRAARIAVLAALATRSLTAQSVFPNSALTERGLTWLSVPASDSGGGQQTRPHAHVHSDLYYTRLTIHRVGSYAMLPLFAGEYLLGNKLLNDADIGARPSHSLRSAHATVAAGLGVLFGVNTVTGLWNLWDSRHESEGATRKYLHAGLLIASDAAMMWAGASASDARERVGGPRRHRNISLGAMGLATIGTVMMWVWN